MALIIAILFSWLSSLDKMRISMLFFVLNNVAKNLKELVFGPPEWNCWMFWNIVASVGAKYILKYSKRLGKQESPLSVDRWWSLTNKIFPKLDEVYLCTRHGIRKLENREVDNIIQQSNNEVRTVYINFRLKAHVVFIAVFLDKFLI